MSKRSGLPRWKCRNRADQKTLERWTNQQLDLIADRPPAALVQNDAEMHRALQALLSDKTLFQEHVAHVRMLLTIKNKRGRGRRRGERRPNDWSDDEVDVLPYAAEDVIRIRQIWKRLGGQNRGDANPPTAIGIAARRHGLTEERLRSLLKNRTRAYRGI
jgi:hypothetical protein